MRRFSWLVVWGWIGLVAFRAVQAQEDLPATESLQTITVEGEQPVSVGPYRGLRLSRDQIPGNLQSTTGEEIRASGATSLTDYMNQHMQGVSVAEYQGNPFQVDVQYRGFTASPQLGTPQGLSVFFDGIRVNEPFGDVVNWDLIPLNAISTFDVHPGSNPLFGRGTLGGALSVRTRNGFDDAGIDTTLLGGSWGRVHGQIAGGASAGPVGGFIALTGFHEDGWRDNSPSEVRQGFGKLTLRNGPLEVNGSLLLAGNELIGNGLVPWELYDRDPTAVFTSPDETRNTLRQFNFDGLLEVSDTFNVTAQAYHRRSDRRSINGDIYRDFDDMSSAWGGAEKGEAQVSNTLPLCRYLDANGDRIPDYGLDQDFDGVIDAGTINTPLTDDNRFLRLDLPPLNNPTNAAGVCDQNLTVTGNIRPFNGKAEGFATQDGAGIVNGAPIATLNRTELDQENRGGALQFNWNLDRHHFMVGAAVDAESSRYLSYSRLADLDADHNVVLFPQDNLQDPLNFNRFFATYNDVQNNAFDGTSTTTSAFFSETFSPTDRLHLSFAGRYNYTFVRNDLAARLASGLLDLHQTNPLTPALLLNDGILCPTADLASCPSTPNTPFSLIPILRGDSVVDPSLQDPLELGGETEKFEYTSFNPAFGINFLPVDDVNLYMNWSQGTRTPSVVELGCAVDPVEPGEEIPTPFPRPVTVGTFRPCTLPTTLSGDPYLPQIEAESFEFGVRSTLPNGWEWNAGAFRTDLENDIYFVGVTAERSFFDTIDRTRRQGLEFGFSGRAGIADFNVGYSLVEATFESSFYYFGQRNSSADFDINQGVRTDVVYPLDLFLEPDGSVNLSVERAVAAERLTKYGLPTYHFAKVDKGDRMPGVPMQNLNASVDLHLTDRWTLGLTMIGRSGTFVRGNENNDHQAGPPANEAEPLVGDILFDPDTGDVLGVTFRPNGGFRQGQPFLRSGKLPGYFLFNMNARFQAAKGLSFIAQINNLLDKEYFSAGRLDANPFSPSIFGKIGPSGWNYNSKDWQNTTFVAPGAPRAFWIGLEYQF